jgi:hypothetical protein
MPAAWLVNGSVTLSGAVLAHVGVQVPDLFPEHLFLLHVAKRTGEAG